MSEIYKRLNGDGSIDVYTRTKTGGELFRFDGGCNHYPAPEQLNSEGFVLFVEPPMDSTTQCHGDHVFSADSCTCLVADLSPEEIAANISDEQSRVWALIKGERDRRKEDGGYYVASADKWFHSDTFSRTQQLGLKMMGSSIPANKLWKTMDGTFVTLTESLVSEIFDAAAASDFAIFTKAEEHKQLMIQESDPLGYDYLTGWPLIFGEGS